MPSKEECPYEPDTFGRLVYNMLYHPNTEKVTEIAEACCNECGGLPGGCTCVDDFVHSPAWKKWQNAATIITNAVMRVNGPKERRFGREVVHA